MGGRKLRITSVYTKSGDLGETALAGGQRLSKDAARIEAYGTVDELMAFLAHARTELVTEARSFVGTKAGADFARLLEYLENKLFTLGGELATRAEDRHPKQAVIGAADIAYLERVCDAYNETLPPLRDFVLPGGSRTSVALHLARTVARRAERRTVSLARQEDIGPHPIVWLNRLSDALFVLSRWVDRQLGAKEVLWNHAAEEPPLPE